MTTGFQIYHFDSRYDQGFVNAGLHNWFSTFEEALSRKQELERTWSKRGVQYIIVQCAGRDFEKIRAGR